MKPHDANGNELNVGDVVTLRGFVVGIQAPEGEGNTAGYVEVRIDKGIAGGNMQVMSDGVASRSLAAVEAPKPETAQVLSSAETATQNSGESGTDGQTEPSLTQSEASEAS